MSHIYALFVVTTALTTNQQQQVDTAFKDIETNTDINPANNMHSRMRNDGQAWILEKKFITNPTKLQVATALANRLSVSVSTINNNSTLTAFANRQAAVDYLIANAAAWGEG